MSGLDILIIIAVIIVVVIVAILLTPFVGYLWGRSQASGWIETYKNSNLNPNNKNNGKTKEEKKQ